MHQLVNRNQIFFMDEYFSVTEGTPANVFNISKIKYKNSK